MDYEKQKESKTSSLSGHAMCYCAKDGSIMPDFRHEGDGYSVSDTLEVDVDRCLCTVKYSVNGVLKAKQFNEMLADANRIFVPFVEM